jgi:Dockerin type I domain
MKNVHAYTVMLVASTALWTVGVAGARAEAGRDAQGAETYISYRTIDQGQLELVFDSTEFSRQGWSVAQDTVVLPMSVSSADALSVMTLNGDFLQAGGSPRALGVVELNGPEGEEILITGFTLPFSGRKNVPLLDAQHPVLELSGESLTFQIDSTELVMRGFVQFHPAARELGLDPDVGPIGEFTFTSRIDIADYDETISAERPVVDGPNAAVLPGADVIVGGLPAIQNWTTGSAIGGLRAYSVATTSCNIGSQPLDWFTGPGSRRHPVIAQNMYRLANGRFEQIGQSWLKHGFCALQMNLCQSCTPVGNCCCSQLGVGCSDPYSASRNGGFGNLGPRSEINPHLGTNLGGHASPTGNSSLRGRILVREDDLNRTLHPGAIFFVEGHYVAEDDAQFGEMTNDNNNASYRAMIVNQNSFFIGLGGGTVREKPAIQAWKAVDPDVDIQNIDIPNDGRLILAHRVTDLGDGTWHYEYALHNLNSELSVGSFSVPVPPGVELTNVEFHDVDYHSGEPYSLTDWAPAEGDGAMTWSTQSFAQNENANALRWGTLYNYRFDANSAPEASTLTLGLFKTSGTVEVPILAPSTLGPAVLHGASGASFADHGFGGFIDPRRESTDGVNVTEGVDKVTFVFSDDVVSGVGSGPVSSIDFEVTETGGATPPTVVSVNASQNPTIVVTLSRPITVQEWTTIRANVRSSTTAQSIPNLGDQGPSANEPDRIDIGFLPGDIDQNGIVNPLDLFLYRQYVNDVTTPTLGVKVDYLDTNRDGVNLPTDLFAFRQLINGVTPPATQAWSGATMNNPRP